jgi:hypothetical protein
MKIDVNHRIPNKSIEVSNEETFIARYKGRYIYITTDHGHGKAQYKWLKRFHMDVIHEKSGMYDCEAVEDHHNINDAIRSALKGSMLI